VGDAPSPGGAAYHAELLDLLRYEISIAPDHPGERDDD
jgi:hypothetical protein